MNKEEIDYWLRYFSNHNHGFMSEDGKKITLFKMFQELKELHFLLKIKNDYIKELEAYKYNMDRDYLRLEKENEELKEELDKLNHIIDKQDSDIVILSKGNKELKKQLEEANEKILLLQASEPMLEYKKALEENQQKDFIKFLENERNINPYDISDYTYEDIINTILSKYYEIIEK